MTATATTPQLPAAAKRSFAREPRWLNPMAWWVWALGLAVAASVTTNPLLLLAVMVVAALVVERRRPDAPWAKSFGFFVRIAVAIVAIRLVGQILFGPPTGTLALLALPGFQLPEWLAGVRLGGPVYLEPFLQALYDGLRLAAIIVAIGAAASLASPARVLKSVPAALYEVGVSVVVASTFLPQLVGDVSRVRANRRLRGRPNSGLQAVGGAMMPVLHGAMDRSITLAAAMDSRGYGRTTNAQSGRHLSSLALLIGIVLSVIGVYLLLGTGAGGWESALGVALLAGGLASFAVSMAVAGRRSIRTRYRPDNWQLPEVVVAASGIGVAACFLAAAALDSLAMNTPTQPPMWPTLPWLAVVGIALAAVPAWAAPAPPRGVR